MAAAMAEKVTNDAAGVLLVAHFSGESTGPGRVLRTVPICEKDRPCAVIFHNRKPGRSWEFPWGGAKDKGGDLLLTARDELFEETAAMVMLSREDTFSILGQGPQMIWVSEKRKRRAFYGLRVDGLSRRSFQNNLISLKARHEELKEGGRRGIGCFLEMDDMAFVPLRGLQEAIEAGSISVCDIDGVCIEVPFLKTSRKDVLFQKMEIMQNAYLRGTFSCENLPDLSSVHTVGKFLDRILQTPPLSVKFIAAGACHIEAETPLGKQLPGDIEDHGAHIRVGQQKRRGKMDRRIEVLLDTLRRFATSAQRDHYLALAQRNVERWALDAVVTTGLKVSHDDCKIEVFEGDWGEVTQMLTKQYGAIFAALNMANAHHFGGGYSNGCAAQEENMFRRTDCHFHDEGYSRSEENYTDEMHDLISGKHGRVYLDASRPRVCIKGREESNSEDIGYRLLDDDEIFPFYELRSAAVDMRGIPRQFYDPAELTKRIEAQLNTLIQRGIQHVVLSAFGCGAFENPAEVVSNVYREKLLQRRQHFRVIAFAIFHAGYGPNNYKPFQEAFAEVTGSITTRETIRSTVGAAPEALCESSTYRKTGSRGSRETSSLETFSLDYDPWDEACRSLPKRDIIHLQRMTVRFAAAYCRNSMRSIAEEKNAQFNSRIITVLLLPGSFNPPHADHLRCLEAASASTTQSGRYVLGCLMQPSSDKYLSEKCGKQAMKLADRVRACEIATKIDRATNPSFSALSSSSSSSYHDDSSLSAPFMGVWRGGKSRGSKSREDCEIFLRPFIEAALKLVLVLHMPVDSADAAILSADGDLARLHQTSETSVVKDPDTQYQNLQFKIDFEVLCVYGGDFIEKYYGWERLHEPIKPPRVIIRRSTDGGPPSNKMIAYDGWIVANSGENIGDLSSTAVRRAIEAGEWSRLADVLGPTVTLFLRQLYTSGCLYLK